MSSAALTNSFVTRSFPSAVSIPLRSMTGIVLCGAILLVWQGMEIELTHRRMLVPLTRSGFLTNPNQKPYSLGLPSSAIEQGTLQASGGGSNAEQATAQAERQELSQTDAWGDPERRKRRLHRSVPLAAVS